MPGGIGINMASTLNFDYHEWLSKSYFSFLSSTSSPLDLLSAAKELQYSSLCVSDFDGVYGLARSFIESKNLDFTSKLNYAAEIHLFEDHESPLLDQVTISVTVIDFNGYRNLNKILTFSHRDSKDRAFISLANLISMDLSGLFAIIPARGALDYFANNKNKILLLKEAFKGQVFFAITKTFCKFYDRKITTALELSRELTIKTIISQDVFMTHRSRKAFHDVLLAIKNNISVKGAGEFFLPNCKEAFTRKNLFTILIRVLEIFLE